MSECTTGNRPCIICGHDLDTSEPQTCVRCLGRTRRHLLDIEEMYALLPEEILGRAGAAAPMDATGVRGEAETPLPGGDAMVMYSDGAVSRTYARRLLHAADDTHIIDEYDTDPQSITGELDAHAADWFTRRNPHGTHETDPETLGSDITKLAHWLDRRLTWAAQHHDLFGAFANHVRKLRGGLARTLRTDTPHEKANITCPECGDDLWKPWNDPNPCDHPGKPHCDHSGHWTRWRCAGGYCTCDQGGRTDIWLCHNRECDRQVAEDEYWVLVRGEYTKRTQDAS